MIITKPSKHFFHFHLATEIESANNLAHAELSSVLPHLIRTFESSVEQQGPVVTQGTLRLDNCHLKATNVDQ